MLISDLMTTNVVTIPSNTSLAEARRIMDAHGIRRLPVVDRHRLAGIVTRDDLDKMGPSQLTTFSVNELVYMLNKITVRDVMHTDVVTVSMDTTIEEGVALAQSRKIGSLLVMDNDRLMGIATTNDLFVGILNPLLGIGLPGSRLVVINCYLGPDIEKVMGLINKAGIKILNLFVSEFPATGKHDLFVHLDTADAFKIAAAIENLGFKVVVRRR